MANASRSAGEGQRLKERRRLHLRELKNDPNAAESVGAELRNARLKKGEDLETVAASLRIRKDVLQAIEDSDYDKQPPKVYTIGFVRAYAKYVGLNPDAMVKRYKNEISGREKDRAPTLVFPDAGETGGFAQGSLFMLAIVIATLVYGAWYVSVNTDTATMDGPRVVAAEDAPAVETPNPIATSTGPATPPVADPDAMTAIAVLAPATQTASAPATPVVLSPKILGVVDGPSRVTLTAIDEAYVRVREVDENGDVKLIFEHSMVKGEVYRVPDKKGLLLRTGNAGGLEIAVDGKKLGPLGQPGDVADRVSLDPARLANRFAPESSNPAPAATTPASAPAQAPPAPAPAAPAPTPVEAPAAQAPGPAAAITPDERAWSSEGVAAIPPAPIAAN